MAKTRFGPAIGAEAKYRFDAGDIVRVVSERHGSKPKCDRSGVVLMREDGWPEYTLSEDAIVCIEKRMLPLPDAMFRLYAGSDEIAPKTNGYLVRVLGERAVQPEIFFEYNLGAWFLVREEHVKQTNKERKIQDLGVWDRYAGEFDSARLGELRNAVHAEELSEKGSSHRADDR